MRHTNSVCPVPGGRQEGSDHVSGEGVGHVKTGEVWMVMGMWTSMMGTLTRGMWSQTGAIGIMGIIGLRLLLCILLPGLPQAKVGEIKDIAIYLDLDYSLL